MTKKETKNVEDKDFEWSLHPEKWEKVRPVEKEEKEILKKLRLQHDIPEYLDSIQLITIADAFYDTRTSKFLTHKELREILESLLARHNLPEYVRKKAEYYLMRYGR